MHRITIDPDGLTRYASTATAMAATLATAGARIAAADPLLLAPALGLIGADFLTAYRAAHTTHLTTVGTLATVLTSLGAATASAEATYATTDATYSAALRAASGVVRA
ncbi:type VII secretion target [Nocardia acidivorans]|uniref:type VII secretion target n=1 Tax=Nocardia acidivorans TaxID=404580 RepID=UPI00082EA1F6|nr:type VII secretion target [Nocardia acidivorans]